MSDLLLITDVPRLGKVFARLADDLSLRLRVAASLEKGAEEILSDKPAMIFVQTHMSGFSADILHKHLKKQLGRRRSRFVLLSPPDQVSEEVLKLYHDHIDTTLDDQPLLDAIRALLDARSPKGRKEAVVPDETAVEPPTAAQPAGVQPAMTAGRIASESMLPASTVPGAAPPSAEAGDRTEPSLEEQGVVYAPRPQLSVYSEFTSSFDSAVSSMPATESAEESLSPHAAAWHHEYPETIETEPVVRRRSIKVTFLLWSLALVVVVVAITAVQHRSSQPQKVELVPPLAGPVVNPAAPASAPASSAPVAAPVAPGGSAVMPPVAEPDARMSDKAVLSDIAENRKSKDKIPASPNTARLNTVPEFIPRSGLDKSYGAANPGWERYKGQVTEFKVFREGEFIKAIQVIDRGGKGVPESFMKGVLRQLTKAPAFIPASSEKKDGYVIQRGQIAENLKVVYYRDAEGGRLRAFVVTWQ